MYRARTKRDGLSLIEVMIYVTVLVVAAAVVVGALLTLGRSYSELRAAQSMQRSAITALERITHEVRLADEVNEGASVFGTHPGVLSLRNETESGVETVEFSLDSGAIRIEENGASAGTLTVQNVTVSNLVFRRVPGMVVDGIRTELTIRAAVGSTTIERTFYSFAVMRK